MTLNAKQQRFVDEYLVDLNATEAAKRAGYSEKTAYAQGQRLLKHVEVQRQLAEGQKERAERTQVSQDWIIERLQHEALLETGGTHSGRVRALELLGKHQSMWTDKMEHSGEMTIQGLTDDQLEDRIKRLMGSGGGAR